MINEKQTCEILNELIRCIFYTAKFSESPGSLESHNLDKVLEQCLTYFNLNNSDIRVMPARELTYPYFYYRGDIEEKQKYLDEICNNINNAGTNIIYVKSIDNIVEQFIDSEHGKWIRKSRGSNSCVYLPRYNAEFNIISASENNVRGHKPKIAIIDSRLSIEVIQHINANLIVCHECRWF